MIGGSLLFYNRLLSAKANIAVYFNDTLNLKHCSLKCTAWLIFPYAEQSTANTQLQKEEGSKLHIVEYIFKFFEWNLSILDSTVAIAADDNKK